VGDTITEEDPRYLHYVEKKDGKKEVDVDICVFENNEISKEKSEKEEKADKKKREEEKTARELVKAKKEQELKEAEKEKKGIKESGDQGSQVGTGRKEGKTR